MGHLLDQSYMNKLSEEISDKLDQQGILNINELIKIYDLPADFLQNVSKKLIQDKRQNFFFLSRKTFLPILASTKLGSLPQVPTFFSVSM